jgi:predicted small lipoprotein YifL
MSDTRLWLTLGVASLLAGCGQTGKLYLPERPGEVVTRPTQTPPPELSVESPNSSPSVDSPPSPDTPAPEVTEPDEAAKKKNGAGAPEPGKKD